MAPSTSRKSRASHSTQYPPGYPTEWSEWQWKADLQLFEAYRKVGPGQYDYEFDRKPPEGAGDSTSNSGTDTGIASSSGHQATQSWNTNQTQGGSGSRSTGQENYGGTNVDALTNQFSGSNISSEGPARSPTGGQTQSYPQNDGTTSTAGSTSAHSPAPQTTPVPLEPPRWVHTKDKKTKVELDKNFKIHKSKDFEFGKVFKVLWAEPKGSQGTVITAQAPSKFGEQAFLKIRRFLVVKTDEGHSICLPILTYGGQGTTKSGVHSSHHAAIYSSNYKEPYILPGEKMFKQPIMMRPSPEHETLDPMSRINYAKLYTVEHNIKVFFIGRITSKHLKHVVFDYNETHRPLPDVPLAWASRDDLIATEGPEPAYIATTSRLGTTNISYSPHIPRPGGQGSLPYPVASGSESGGAYTVPLKQAQTEGEQVPDNEQIQAGSQYPTNSFPGIVATSSLSPPVISSRYGAVSQGPPQPSEDSSAPFDSSSLYDP